MIDVNKNYKGKIVKLHYTINGHDGEATGIILDQKNSGNNLLLNMIELNGQTREFNSHWFQFNKISSVRLDKGVRDALEGLYKAKCEQKEFLDSFWKQKAVLEGKVAAASKLLQEQTGELSFDEFSKEIKNFFSETFPTSNSSHRMLFFNVDSVGPKEFTVSHNQEVDKYPSPDQYSFIYREYDNTLHLRSNDPGMKTFAQRHAPNELPQLAGKAKSLPCVSLGDKYLYASRVYTFPMKYGQTRKSIDYIKDLVLSPVKAKSSLDEKIIKASSKKTQPEAGKKTQKKNLGR